MIACRALLSITILSVSVLNFVPTMKSLYVCLAPTSCANLPERLLPRATLTLTLAALSAFAAVEVHDIGTLLDWLGSVLGAPELLLAPMLLLAKGHVGKLSSCSKVTIVIVVALLHILLWIAAVASNVA